MSGRQSATTSGGILSHLDEKGMNPGHCGFVTVWIQFGDKRKKNEVRIVFSDQFEHRQIKGGVANIQRFYPRRDTRVWSRPVLPHEPTVANSFRRKPPVAVSLFPIRIFPWISRVGMIWPELKVTDAVICTDFCMIRETNMELEPYEPKLSLEFPKFDVLLEESTEVHERWVN